jgi:hypothetical protein
MKRISLSALVLMSLMSVGFSQKIRYGQELPKAKAGVDYPIKIHLSGVHLRSYCKVSGAQAGYAECEDACYADALLNGAKIELMGYCNWTKAKAPDLIGLGDYQARLIKGMPKNGTGQIGEEYELILADRTIWRTTVTGISE